MGFCRSRIESHHIKVNVSGAECPHKRNLVHPVSLGSDTCYSVLA